MCENDSGELSQIDIFWELKSFRWLVIACAAVYDCLVKVFLTLMLHFLQYDLIIQSYNLYVKDNIIWVWI